MKILTRFYRCTCIAAGGQTSVIQNGVVDFGYRSGLPSIGSNIVFIVNLHNRMLKPTTRVSIYKGKTF